MHFFSIDEHTITCYGNRPKWFLFQYQYDFYLIFYCSCHEHIEHLDFKLNLIKSVAKIVGKKEKFDKYDQYNNIVEKSYNLKECIKHRKIDFLLSRNIIEVSSIYLDCTGKEFCFGINHTYSEFLANNVNYKMNYFNAINQIKQKEIFNEYQLYYLLDELSELRRHNDTKYEDLTDIQKINLTKLLSKNFIKTYTHDYKSNKL